MCGIFAVRFQDKAKVSMNHLRNWSETIRHRGPDDTTMFEDDHVLICFHRLRIVDLTPAGDQPFVTDRYVVVCNGEIYNYRELIQSYDLQTSENSTSDCAILIPLIEKLGFVEAIQQLEGVFAIVLYDRQTHEFKVARDRFGVRPLFYAEFPLVNSVGYASEMKPFILWPRIVPVMRGDIVEDGKATGSLTIRAAPTSPILCTAQTLIRNVLTAAVKRQMQGDRPLGCLLSGGLDSSLIAYLLCHHLRDTGKPRLKTFSVGMAGSTDLQQAAHVALLLGTEHHEVVFTEQEGLAVLEPVIVSLESYDVTTVRASIGMWLLCKYIAEKTDVRIIFSGEGSDEVAQGYLYFHRAPSQTAAHVESLRLLHDLMYFDNLRTDRCTAAHGLEVRVPFLDYKYVYNYLGLPAAWRIPKDGIEKYWLRSCFADIDMFWVWRPKEAFSDGVSSPQRSWHHVLQEYAQSQVTETDMKEAAVKYPHHTPHTPEALLYRQIFEKYFAGHAQVIPYQWLPKWTTAGSEPSARALSWYQ